MSLIAAIPEVLIFVGAGASPLYWSWRKFRTRKIPAFDAPDKSAKALDFQSLYGYNEHSLVSISGEKKFWFDDAGKGAISYVEHGNVRLVTSEPLADAENLAEITVQFVEKARAEKKIAAFMPVTERFARLARTPDLDIVKIGAAPYFDLQKWNPRGNKAKHLRAALNRAKKSGISVTQIAELNGSFCREVDELCENWLAARQAGVKFGWLFELNPFDHAECKKFFAARDESGKLVGMLAASPMAAREGWYLEDVLRRTDAPHGTAETLVAETLRILAAEGAKLATLGTIPLAEDGTDEFQTDRNFVTKKCLQIARQRLHSIYNFDGLRRFKSKFVPCWWESEYVVAQKGLFVAPRIVNAFLRAIIPGGVTSLIRRKP